MNCSLKSLQVAPQRPASAGPAAWNDNERQARLPLHRPAGSPCGGRASHHWQGPLQRRLSARRADLRRDGALAVCACAHPRHRHDAGAQYAGRAGCFHRCRLSRRRTAADPARSAAEDQIRHEAARARRRSRLHRTAYAVASRQGTPRRRGGRDGDCRNQGAGARRCRSRRGRLRGTALRHPCGRRHASRRTAGVGRDERQHVGRDLVRRPRCDRQGLCRRRPRGEARSPHRPRHRRADRAASGGCALRFRGRQVHALCRLGRRGAAEERALEGARHRARQAARSLLRCRRQLRHPQPRVRRVRPGALGGEESRASGQVHGDALGSFSKRLSGPRPGYESRARAAQGWPLSRDAGDQHQQCRCPRGVVLAALQGLRPDPGVL